MTQPKHFGQTSPAYSFQLEIELDKAQLDHTIATLEDRMSVGLEHWMRGELSSHLRDRARSRFASEGDDASGPWAPLKPATQAIRQNKGYSPSGPINIRTYDLYSYIVGDPGSVGHSGGWSFTWPNTPLSQQTFDKLQTAQRGKASPNTTDRPVVALGVTDYNEILDSLAAYLMDGLM